jgi:hypothetical protein
VAIPKNLLRRAREATLFLTRGMRHSYLKGTAIVASGF